jgi:hypothetical protein
MREYGFDALAFVRACERLLGASLPVTAADLERVELPDVHSDAKPEAL